MIFASFFVLLMGGLWWWTDHLDRREQHHNAFRVRQGSCVRTIRQPFDFEKD